jgi:hypothetical protein
MCSGNCQTTFQVGTEHITVKDEESFDAEVGEGPEPISFPEIKAEHEVSCMSVL